MRFGVAVVCVALAAGMILPAASAPDIGAKAPALKIKDLSGKPFDLQDAARKGPVFVNFWSTWCAPCKAEFPLVSRLAARWQKQGMSFIGIAIKDKAQAVRKFAEERKPSQRIALDASDAVFNGWDLDFVPASFLVGKGGKVVAFYDQFDASDLSAIEKDFRKALEAYKKPRK